MPDMRLAHLHPLRWLGQRDRGFAALRRATRTAIIMPAMFALGDKVIGNPQLATFAAFGSFAMLLLVDFGGPMAERLQAEAALAVTGGVFVCLATLASQTAWLAAVAMAVVGFGVIFAGVVSSVLAGASHGAAAGVHLAGVAGRSGVGRARPAGRLGDGRRRRAGCDGAPVARASARPAAWCRGRRLPGAGRPAACGGRVPAQRHGRTICAGSRSRGCAVGPGRRGAAQCLPGDALPPDRVEHSR